MQVRKAVITAAGRGSRQQGAGEIMPAAMNLVVDRDGVVKPVLQVIAEEALASGIEQIGVIAAPRDEEIFRRAFQPGPRPSAPAAGAGEDRDWQALGRRLHFIVQSEPLGYGHAVWCARSFVGSEPFLLLVSDHLYVSGEERRCARQVLDLAAQEGCSVAAVQATREHLIHRFGTVAGKRIAGRANVFAIETVVEKPTPSLAEQRLHVPGLRVGHYLCFFGMHVLTPTLMEILDQHVEQGRRSGEAIGLSPALQELAGRERYLAVQANGRRYDVGARYGLLEAQVALAMAGVDRELVLARLMELLLQREQDRAAALAEASTGRAGPGE